MSHRGTPSILEMSLWYLNIRTLMLMGAATMVVVTRAADLNPTGANDISSVDGGVPSQEGNPSPHSLRFVSTMKNYTHLRSGQPLKLKCEVEGNPPATSVRWYRHEELLKDEKPRIRLKEQVGEGKTQWNRIKFRNLETTDTGFYKCEASNGLTTIASESFIKVFMASKYDEAFGSEAHYNYDDDYDESGLVPQSFPLDFGADLSAGIEGLPPHLQFHNNKGDDFGTQQPSARGRTSKHNSNNFDLPSLKPNEMAGRCQRYTGSICSRYIPSDTFVFVSEGLTLSYIEQKLQASLQVISNSPELRNQCAEFAIPAICLSTLPLCDKQTQKPRKICRHECEVLEFDICKKELAIAKSQPMIHHQLVLPECQELPQISTPESYNCVRLGIPHVNQLIKPMMCYNGDKGTDYRGTVSVTQSGLTCKPWHLTFGEATEAEEFSFENNVELFGGHNYCRNPEGPEQEDQPWCYTSDPRRPKEVCNIPQCSDFDLFLHVVLPVAGACLLLVATIAITCCMRRRWRKKPLMGSVNGASSSTRFTGSSPRSVMTTQQSIHHHSEMEMNSLIPPPLPQFNAPKPRAREYPITSVRFNQEMGDGSFGKVYKGDLGGIIGGGGTHVVIKTLRPGANTQLKADFQREIDLWSDLKHPNVVSLLGVVLKDDPQCLIFEHMSQGDLHEFLIQHGPKSDMASSLNSDDTTELDRMVDPADLSFIAIQVAAGMEYLASRNYVHRDVAARNCLVGDNLSIKISDFGLSRDIYAADYYRVQTKSLLPVRWMPPESILFGNFTTESDVWAFGVLLWEVYSYGLQPYYGYSNQEVIEMIRTRQLLPCPEDCPSRMYAFMVECWHEVPSRRPQFAEIHARLRHWESMSTGYQSASHSMAETSVHSGSQHSSTGPSNNTGSTNLSTQFLLQQQHQHQHQHAHGHPAHSSASSNGGYSKPFAHLLPGQPAQNPTVGMLQMASGPNGTPHTMLVQGNPFLNGSQKNGQNSSVGSLQMV